MKDKLMIFDMDGTLFDTKDVNFLAYKEAISVCGFPSDIDYEYYCKFCNGNNYKVFLPHIVENASLESMEAIHENKKRLYPKHLNRAKKNEPLFSLIETARRRYVIALVTNASRKNTLELLRVFHVEGYFDMIVVQEDVTEPKPSPECFLKAMSLAGIGKNDTLIFEDSESGLTAARLSGAHYLRVYGYN